MRKTSIKRVNIGFSCSKKYESMAPQQGGSFCGNCEKVVLDFSNLTNQEIVEYFEVSSSKTCGRFHGRQLDELNKSLEQEPPKYLKTIKAGVLGATLLASSCNTTKELNQDCNSDYASSYVVVGNLESDSDTIFTIKGIVLDELDYPVIGANIIVDDSSLGTQTDFDGKFELKIRSELSDSVKLSTKYIGYQTLDVKLLDLRNKEVKITMSDSGFMLGEIVVKYPIHKRIWNGIRKVFR